MDIVGLEAPDLPEHWTPLAAVVIFKCLDEDGTPGWCQRVASDLNAVEKLGMLRLAEQWALDDLSMSTEDDD